MALDPDYVEYTKLPDCGVPNEILERLVDAALIERHRRADLIKKNEEIAWCGCRGPIPDCGCIRRNVKHEIAAALAIYQAL